MTVSTQAGGNKSRTYTVTHDNGTESNELQISVGQYPQIKPLRSPLHYITLSTNDHRLYEDIRINALGYTVAADPVLASVTTSATHSAAVSGSSLEEAKPPYVIEFKIKQSFLARNNLDRFLGTTLSKLVNGFVIGAEDAGAIQLAEKEFRPPTAEKSMFGKKPAYVDEQVILRLPDEPRKGSFQRG